MMDRDDLIEGVVMPAMAAASLLFISLVVLGSIIF
jgi:hypothetical protein